MKLAAAYLRVSTDEQAEHGVSLPDQKSRLLAYIKAQGWELYDYYIDDGYSGKDLERPAMQKLLKDINQEKFNYIIVIKLDRFSRRQKDVLYLLEDVLEPHNVGFKSVTEPFDTTTPFGKAAIGMMAVFAQLERETIVERVKSAKKEAAKQGRFGGGGIPFGYNYSIETKKLTINDETSQIVQIIYNMYETGKYGFRALADDLNQRYSSPTGGIWYKDTVKNILTNPHYAGYVHRCGELSEGQHDQIIERERWHKIQTMISGRYTPRPTKADENLLTGLIYCGRCGARLRFKTQSWKVDGLKKWSKTYYICYSRMHYDRMATADKCDLPFIPTIELNNAVIDYIVKMSLSPTLLKSAVDNALKKREKSSSKKDLNTLKKELISMQKKIDRWNTAFENGAIEIDDLMQRTKELRERRKFLEEQVKEIEHEIENETNAIVTSKAVIEQIKHFNEIWQNANSSEQRIIISALVDKVLIYDKDNIEIKLNI